MTMEILSLYQETSANITQYFDFTPTRILEIELSQPLLDLSALKDSAGQLYHKALCLVRLHSQPLGRVELALNQNGTLSTQTLAHCIWQTLGEQINAHLLQDGLPAISQLEEQGI